MTADKRQKAFGHKQGVKLTLYALCALLFTLCVRAEAQQVAKIPRIGYLTGATPEAQSSRTDAFRQGLRDLGYVEGKNITIEWRHAEDNSNLYSALAAELVHLKVDVTFLM